MIYHLQILCRPIPLVIGPVTLGLREGGITLWTPVKVFLMLAVTSSELRMVLLKGMVIIVVTMLLKSPLLLVGIIILLPIVLISISRGLAVSSVVVEVLLVVISVTVIALVM